MQQLELTGEFCCCRCELFSLRMKSLRIVMRGATTWAFEMVLLHDVYYFHPTLLRGRHTGSEGDRTPRTIYCLLPLLSSDRSGVVSCGFFVLLSFFSVRESRANWEFSKILSPHGVNSSFCLAPTPSLESREDIEEFSIFFFPSML